MSDVQHKRSLWLGALCSTLAPPIVLLLVALLLQSRTLSLANLLKGMGGIFFMATPVSFLATLCLGLPLALLLRSLTAFSWASVCIGSAAIGAVSFAIFSWVISWNHQTPGLSQYVIGAVLGLVSGVAFCVGSGPNSSSKRTREKPRAA